MAGKNGSIQQTAAGASSAEQHQPREVPGERRFYIVHNPNDRNDKARAPQLGTGRRRGMLDCSQQAQLGNLLRAIFSDVAEEPVPERFVKLLEALEAREKSGE